MGSDQATVRNKPHPVANRNALRSLQDVRPLYMLPNDPLVEEVLIPGFQTAANVDCMVGFFSSGILASLAPGLATYISDSESSFRLIISPLLPPEDQAAIEEGIKSSEAIAQEVLEDLIVTEDLLYQRPPDLTQGDSHERRDLIQWHQGKGGFDGSKDYAQRQVRRRASPGSGAVPGWESGATDVGDCPGSGWG